MTGENSQFKLKNTKNDKILKEDECVFGKRYNKCEYEYRNLTNKCQINVEKNLQKEIETLEIIKPKATRDNLINQTDDFQCDALFKLSMKQEKVIRQSVESSTISRNTSYPFTHGTTLSEY